VYATDVGTAVDRAVQRRAAEALGAMEASVVEAAVGVGCAAGTSVEASIGTVVEAAVEAFTEVAVGAVVPEAAAVPVAAVEADTEVAEAVVDATVVADGAAPVATVPAIVTAVPAPVAGRPESADVGSDDPGTVYPVVAAVTPGPVAGCPEIAVAGALGLVVGRNGGRSVASFDDDLCLGLSRPAAIAVPVRRLRSTRWKVIQLPRAAALSLSVCSG
jgi:hypothetical protein